MKKYLIVVDMQNDFISGALGSAEAEKIVPRVVEKVAVRAKEEDCALIFTRDTHGENYLETQEGVNLPVRHCVKGTEGWLLHPELRPFAAEALCFDKPTFGSRALAEYLAERNAEDPIAEIELCGLCTDICVISNALLLKAFLPEVKITVDASRSAGVTPQSHQNALNALKLCQVAVLNGAG